MLDVVGEPACGYRGKTNIFDIFSFLRISIASSIDGVPYRIPSFIVIFDFKLLDNKVNNFKLGDLKSRTKNCLVAKIDKPDDDLMFALILKNFSDRQITIDKKLIDFIIKRIDRSYDKIFEFIYKIDELSLKKKKPIDFKTIKEVLKA